MNIPPIPSNYNSLNNANFIMLENTGICPLNFTQKHFLTDKLINDSHLSRKQRNHRGGAGARDIGHVFALFALTP